MHTLAESHLRNLELPSVQPLSEYLFKQAKPDLDKIDNIHAIEQALFSKELGVAGTVDCIAEYEGELAVIDFKTSKKPKPKKWIEHYFVQCAAYACMLYEMTGIMVKKFVIIMSCENGECVVYEEYDKRKYIQLLSKYIREFVEFKLQEYVPT
jgi:genome maintenance exonuclease 1